MKNRKPSVPPQSPAQPERPDSGMEDDIYSAKLHYESGDKKKAEEICKQIVARRPKLGQPWYLLGAIAHENRELAAAVERLIKAISCNKLEPTYHHRLGNVYQDQGNLERASNCYRKAVRLNPKFAEAFNDLGTVFDSKGAVDDAIVCYREAARLRPDSSVAFSNLGAALRKKGLYNEARKSYQSELKLRVRESFRRALGRPKPK